MYIYFCQRHALHATVIKAIEQSPVICEKAILSIHTGQFLITKNPQIPICLYKRLCPSACCVRDEKARATGFLWVLLIDLM